MLWTDSLGQAVGRQHIPAQLCSGNARRSSGGLLDRYNLLNRQAICKLLIMTVGTATLQLDVILANHHLNHHRTAHFPTQGTPGELDATIICM